MRRAVIFCKSPHISGTIGEISREIGIGLILAGYEITYLSSCEPVSYVESSDGVNYPISLDGNYINCLCASENIIVGTYDNLISINPSLIVSVGERPEMDIVSAAMQVAGIDARHVHVWLGSSDPSHSINDSASRLNAILCFGDSVSTFFRNVCPDVLSLEIRGEDIETVNDSQKKYAAVFGGPSNDISNLNCVFEALDGYAGRCFSFTNLYEPGDYDSREMSSVYSCNVDFGEDPYGTFYGLDNKNLHLHSSASSAIIDVSLRQSSCLAVDYAIRAGSVPILIRTPRHVEMLKARGADDSIIEAITIECSKFRPSGGDAIWICDPKKLKEKFILLEDSAYLSGISNVIGSRSVLLPKLSEEVSKFFQ